MLLTIAVAICARLIITGWPETDRSTGKAKVEQSSGESLRTSPTLPASESMAYWSAELPNQHWPGEGILETTLGDIKLAVDLGQLVFMLEKEFPHVSRQVTNHGGWQSKDVTGFPDTALQRFVQLLHDPFTAWLKKGLGGRLPSRLKKGHSVAVAAIMHELWVNINRPGDYNRPHDHGQQDDSHVVSGVYFPVANTSEQSLGKTTSDAHIQFLHRNEVIADIAPSGGMLLLFPPQVWHHVEPVPPAESARISLAFNLRVRWLDQPILQAAIAGNHEDVATLVENGTDIEAADGVLGLRAMHLAAEAGHTAVVDTLIRLGGNTSALSRQGWSPLGLAAERGHTSLVQRLGGGFEARLVTP